MYPLSPRRIASAMRSKGSAQELARRRRLAVRRVLEGYSRYSVARFLGVSRLAVRRWVRAYEHGGWNALDIRPSPGRPARLSAGQAAVVLDWLKHPAQQFGFATERWTAPRVGRLIAERFSVRFHARYL